MTAVAAHDVPRAIVLRWAGASCVVLATDVLAIDSDGREARIPVKGEALPLADSVPGAVDAPDAHSPFRLIVRAARRYVAFRAAAEVTLKDGLRLYRLPRVLAGGACAPWLRGLAIVRDDATGEEQPTPWIDLAALAAAQLNPVEA